ncbi:MAG TPA: hypothetical protein VNR60_03745 [Croceibacterium sp.]|nr:hypothetical protein [Croceibacterium sp.]
MGRNMGPGIRWVALAAMTFALQGCLAKAAVDVATLPVKAVGKGVDLATTSQEEADRNRGREIRQREEKLGRLQRQYDRQMKRCQDGDRRACDEARIAYAEMQQILPSIPAEPTGN